MPHDDLPEECGVDDAKRGPAEGGAAPLLPGAGQRRDEGVNFVAVGGFSLTSAAAVSATIIELLAVGEDHGQPPARHRRARKLVEGGYG